MKKNLAFTLAETLIVIGIIGVVAALTLPNLNHATGDKEKVTKVKKIYSALTDAFDRAQAVYGDFDTWFDNGCGGDSIACMDKLAKRLTEFMKVSKNEGFVRNPLFGEGSYVITLSDGTSIHITFVKLDKSENFMLGKMYVDIDGPNKGKNEKGNDIFFFQIEPSINGEATLYPDGGSNCCTGPYLTKSLNWNEEEDGGSFKESDYNTSKSGYYTSWVIQNGNMDYLKCYEELNWETQTSCK